MTRFIRALRETFANHRATPPRPAAKLLPGSAGESVVERLEERRLFAVAPGPQVTALTLDNRGQAIVTFSEAIDKHTVGKSTVKIFTAGRDGKFGTADDVAAPLSFAVGGATLTATAKFKHDVRYRLLLVSATDSTVGLRGATTGLPLNGDFATALPSGDRRTGGNFDATTSSTSRNERYTTSAGAMTLALNSATPGTSNNFINYANSGKYDNLFIQRNGKSDAAPLGPINILQGGGFVINASDKLDRNTTLNSGIAHERNGGSNLRGTIALARSSSANSGSGEWFFNTQDNLFLDPTPNDPNEGTPDNDPGAGYTVFGRLIGRASLRTMDAIFALPTANLNPTDSTGAEQDVGLHSVPLVGDPTATTFDPSKNLVVISRVAQLMNFTATSKAAPIAAEPTGLSAAPSVAVAAAPGTPFATRALAAPFAGSSVSAGLFGKEDSLF